MRLTGKFRLASLGALSAVALAGCGAPVTPDTSAPPTPVALEPVDASSLDGVVITVTSSESCGCCKEWVAYLEERGAELEVIYSDDVPGLKERSGIPKEAWSCHTSSINGYVVEGHVPAEAILDLLAERPDVVGIALPGMPSGSPGMPGDVVPLEVVSFDGEGQTESFGSY